MRFSTAFLAIVAASFVSQGSVHAQFAKPGMPMQQNFNPMLSRPGMPMQQGFNPMLPQNSYRPGFFVTPWSAGMPNVQPGFHSMMPNNHGTLTQVQSNTLPVPKVATPPVNYPSIPAAPTQPAQPAAPGATFYPAQPSASATATPKASQPPAPALATPKPAVHAHPEKHATPGHVERSKEPKSGHIDHLKQQKQEHAQQHTQQTKPEHVQHPKKDHEKKHPNAEQAVPPVAQPVAPANGQVNSTTPASPPANQDGQSRRRRGFANAELANAVRCAELACQNQDYGTALQWIDQAVTLSNQDPSLQDFRNQILQAKDAAAANKAAVIQQLVQGAQQALSQQDYDLAQRLVDQAIFMTPGDASLINLRGQIMSAAIVSRAVGAAQLALDAQDFVTALQCIDQALAQLPSNTDLQGFRAAILANMGM